MTMRMMLVSDAKRNNDLAHARCEQYGIDYDEARAWALAYAREH
jgi:hypothetical protein